MDSDISVVALYDDADLQIILPNILTFGNALSDRLGIKLTNVFISYTGVKKGHEYSINQQSINRIIKSLESKTFDMITLASNDKVKEDKWVTRFEIDIIDIHPRNHYQIIALYIDPVLVNDFSVIVKFNLYNFIYENLILYGEINYSYITLLNYFSCRTFVRGIITQDLNIEQKKDIVLWENNLGMRKSFMRGIYLGNYMGPGHLAKIDDLDTFLQLLSDIVGIDNISRFGDQLIFFMLPEDSFDQRKNRTESLLNKYNLLINIQNAEKNVEKSLSLFS